MIAYIHTHTHTHSVVFVLSACAFVILPGDLMQLGGKRPDIYYTLVYTLELRNKVGTFLPPFFLQYSSSSSVVVDVVDARARVCRRGE